MALEGVPGADDPALEAAIARWLEGEDLPALEAFSELAKGGNVAAQMLLSWIDDNAHMHRHVTKDIPRKERIALMRVPRGISGKSWLSVAAQNYELARVLNTRLYASLSSEALEAENMEADLRLLITSGEPGAAFGLLLLVLQNQLHAGVLEPLQMIRDVMPTDFVPFARYVADSGPL